MTKFDREEQPQKTEVVEYLWTPVFSHFMHEYLTKNIGQNEDIDSFFMQREIYMSHVLQHAINCDLYAEGVFFPAGNCLDIGTPDDLEKAIFCINQPPDRSQ